MIQTKQTPAVSVIVPIYKVESYLRECLDSVVNQTLNNIEIVCVDDGSPDNSAQIVMEYAQKYPNIKLIRKENGGLSSARNAGLDVASGEYVYFLDSDDYIEPDMLQNLLKQANKNNLDIVYFNTNLVFENDQIRQMNQNYVDYYTRRHDYPRVCTGQSMFAQMRSHREFFPSVCLQLFRRDLIERSHLRFYEGIIHEDNLFSFQCMILAERVGYNKNKYYHRRMHGDSIMTSSKSMKNVEGYLVTYGEILAFMHGREVEEAAFEHLSEFLYTSIWGNARRIYRGLNVPDEEAVLTRGDFCTEHFLDMLKRCGETEFDRSRLKDENARLKRKIQELQKTYNSARNSKCGPFMYLTGKIAGFVQCIKDHGFSYTVRLAFRKFGNVLGKIGKKLSGNKLFRILLWPVRKVINVSQTMQKYGATYHFRAWRVKHQMKKEQPAPLVSLILPVYNAAEFLEQGLDTLKNQTLHNIEIITVDDGSTDNSLEILRRYEATDKRFRVLQQKNQFAGAARNLGLANARGEYVIFLDSDDFFARSLCEDAYFAGKVHNADVVLFGAKHFNNATKQYKEAPWLLQAQLAPEKHPFNYRDCPDVLYRISTPAPWTKMFRRAFVEEKGLQFQTLHNTNDLFFTYCAMAMAERIATVNKSLVYYRVGLETNLQTKKKKYPLCFYEAYLAWHDVLKKLGTLDILRVSYVNIVLSGCLHNLRTNGDPETKKLVFDKLKYEAFDKLEVSGYPQSYYYVHKNYKDMMMILNGSFEEYLEAQE